MRRDIFVHTANSRQRSRPTDKKQLSRIMTRACKTCKWLFDHLERTTRSDGIASHPYSMTTTHLRGEVETTKMRFGQCSAEEQLKV